MENNHMDKRIREMMENLDAPIQNGHWEQMENLLNDPANADLSENPLDHELRNKLSEVDPEFSIGHWALMENQLEAEFNTPEIEDVFLDGVTYEAMNEFKVPYNEEHWPIMKKRLDEEFSLRYKLIKYKVAELTLVALALFTIVQFLPIDKVSSFHFPIAKNESPNLDTDAQLATTDQNGETSAQATPTSPATIYEASTTTVATPSQIETTESLSSNQTTTDSRASIVEENKKSRIKNSRKATTAVPPLPAFEAIALSNTASANKNSLNNQYSANTAESKSNNSIDDLLEAHLNIIPTINDLGPTPITSSSNEEITDLLKSETWKAPAFLRVGMVGAGDINYVMTPYNEEYNRSGTNQFEAGYGGGLMVGFKFGRWEIETGAMYANKYYSPDTINVTINSGNIAEGYEGIAWKGTQLDLLRIPLRARYNHSKAGKWQFYTQGGIAMNLTMNKIHSKEVVRLGPPPASTSLRSPQSPTQIYTDVNENTGLLREGLLTENSYLTVDLGFGIERLLSSRFSIFAQPSFHYQLFDSKIGYNGERLNNLSIETGVRVSLKRAAEKK